MEGPSFSDLANLLKKPTPPVEKPPAPTADKWLSNFSLWLEDSYQELVHHERTPGLHASSLYETCARKLFLINMYQVGPEHLTAGQLATFDMGHMMHWWWQHRYLGPKQELWGNWYCSGCGSTTTGFMPLECPCGKDWRTAISYKELKVEDKELKYTGHTDGVLVDRVSHKRRIFEFKSSSPSDFKEIERPKSAHVIQAHAYMRYFGYDEALIVYQNKGSQCEWRRIGEDFVAGKLNIKPYVVQYDPAVWSRVEKMIKDYHVGEAELTKLLKDGKTVTEDVACKWGRICSSKYDDAAKYCPVRAQCFAMRSSNDVAKPVDPLEEFQIPS